jgi:hypothetical protein
MHDKFTRRKLVFPFPGDSTTVTLSSQDLEIGWVKDAIIDASALPNTVTATMTVTDGDGYIWFTSSPVTGGTAPGKIGGDPGSAEKGDFGTDEKFSVTLTLSGALAAAKTAYVLLAYKF